MNFAKYLKPLALIRLVLATALLCALGACDNSDNKKMESEVNDQKAQPQQELVFLSALDYPPFSYISRGEIVGFDIDLAKEIATNMGRKPVFIDSSFAAIMPSLNAGKADLAIAMIEATPERQRKVDFSIPYYRAELVAMFKKDSSFTSFDDLKDRKVSCQMGSTMEAWAKERFAENQIVSFPKSNQAIESVVAGHVDAVLLDESQANYFDQLKCEEASMMTVIKLDSGRSGYALAFAKGRNEQLRSQVDEVLNQLHNDGFISALKKKWLYKKCDPENIKSVNNVKENRSDDVN